MAAALAAPADPPFRVFTRHGEYGDTLSRIAWEGPRVDLDFWATKEVRFRNLINLWDGVPAVVFAPGNRLLQVGAGQKLDMAATREGGWEITVRLAMRPLSLTLPGYLRLADVVAWELAAYLPADAAAPFAYRDWCEERGWDERARWLARDLDPKWPRCVECNHLPADYFTDEQVTLTSQRGGGKVVPRVRNGWCAFHAPAGAYPVQPSLAG